MNVNKVLTENISYKVVSLLIALILWLTILGRRDFTLSRTMDIEAIATSGLVIENQSVDTVKVKVSGPRTALRKFMESGLTPLITIDVTKKGVGVHSVDIPIEKIDVPFGVKVLSVRPINFRVKVIKRESL